MYASPYWMTYRQAELLNGQVRKGEKASHAVLYKTIPSRDSHAGDGSIDNDNDDTRTRRLLRGFAVFNADQIDGLSSPSGRRRLCIEIWANCWPRKSPSWWRPAMPVEAPARRHVATLENAYRVAQKIADATDQDMQVAATGEPERPFVAEPADDRTRGVVARIVSR